MRVIPTLEILNRRPVSLRKGRFDDPMVWHVDPVETAQGFAEAGAEALRVTDFDAILGSEGSDELIGRIIREVGIPVQIAGGIRSRDRAEAWIDRGAAQVVVGSMAALHPDVVKAMVKYHPDQIILSLDVWQGSLMTHGWLEKSAISPASMLEAFAGEPLAGVVITDIDSDIEDVDAQLGLISGLAAQSRHPVIASGVVEELDDVARLKYIPNIAGVLVGRALMKKTFTLAEALAAAAPEAEPVAEFL